MVPTGKTSRNSEAVDRGGRKEAGRIQPPAPRHLRTYGQAAGTSGGLPVLVWSSA